MISGSVKLVTELPGGWRDQCGLRGPSLKRYLWEGLQTQENRGESSPRVRWGGQSTAPTWSRCGWTGCWCGVGWFLGALLGVRVNTEGQGFPSPPHVL